MEVVAVPSRLETAFDPLEPEDPDPALEPVDVEALLPVDVVVSLELDDPEPEFEPLEVVAPSTPETTSAPL